MPGYKPISFGSSFNIRSQHQPEFPPPQFPTTLQLQVPLLIADSFSNDAATLVSLKMIDQGERRCRRQFVGLKRELIVFRIVQ